MLKKLSGVLEKTKNLSLPTVDKKESTQQTAAEPAATPKPAKKKTASPAPAVNVAANGRVQVQIAPEDKAKTLPAKYRDAVAGNAIAEFTYDSASVENADLVIEAAYKQVFGNAYLMESERSKEAESQMRSGEISVLEFVRRLAKSDRYRTLFFEKCPNVTAVELNFKHLLGRAPDSYEEIAQHLRTLSEEGFEAEIDSYLDSDEYFRTFGDMRVPYIRGYSTQTGKSSVGFTRSFSLFGAACSSDKSMFTDAATPDLKPGLLQNSPGSIPPLNSLPDSYSADLLKAPMPRYPKELRVIARELLSEIQERQGKGAYRNY
ncbi:phycobilisome linker polypeptide [Leptolyngbya sp. Heron Island J]|uniref:phycobilisome rod-core linker polypeptide n=1 Tax=Leptolyngbya sp. Heron Island J TaxID=1385935 RepID=UPI0003B952B4|nr:phycobilisome rod-core linker polypeptide [Leptolyngbya sp. Heron Island J]ESA36842.1 phycobilisome linker polypeptide [Leptolyngbya sp. Heron Island J]